MFTRQASYASLAILCYITHLNFPRHLCTGNPSFLCVHLHTNAPFSFHFFFAYFLTFTILSQDFCLLCTIEARQIFAPELQNNEMTTAKSTILYEHPSSVENRSCRKHTKQSRPCFPTNLIRATGPYPCRFTCH